MSLLDYSFESNPLPFPLHALFFTWLILGFEDVVKFGNATLLPDLP